MVGTYAGTEAVANSGDSLHAEGLAHVLNGLGHNGVDDVGLVSSEPLHNVDVAIVQVIGTDLSTVEQIREDGQVAIVGELIDEKLVVGEEAEDVGQVKNGCVGLLAVLGGTNVGLDCEHWDFC